MATASHGRESPQDIVAEAQKVFIWGRGIAWGFAFIFAIIMLAVRFG